MKNTVKLLAASSLLLACTLAGAASYFVAANGSMVSQSSNHFGFDLSAGMMKNFLPSLGVTPNLAWGAQLNYSHFATDSTDSNHGFDALALLSFKALVFHMSAKTGIKTIYHNSTFTARPEIAGQIGYGFAPTLQMITGMQYVFNLDGGTEFYTAGLQWTL